MFTFQALKSQFERRGVEILPADASGLAELERISQRKLPYEIKVYFELFNGFVDGAYDGQSMIELWSVEKVIACSNEQRPKNLLTLPLGDFFIGAEIIISDISSPQCPVFWYDRRERIADSPNSLLEGILAGKFDLESD